MKKILGIAFMSACIISVSSASTSNALTIGDIKEATSILLDMTVDHEKRIKTFEERSCDCNTQSMQEDIKNFQKQINILTQQNLKLSQEVQKTKASLSKLNQQLTLAKEAEEKSSDGNLTESEDDKKIKDFIQNYKDTHSYQDSLK